MPHVCPLHHWIYLPVMVWRQCAGHAWRREQRAATLTAAEARIMASLLVELAEELERIEAAEREQVTRAEVAAVARVAA